MITNRRHADLQLWEVGDLDGALVPPSVRETFDWARSYLSRPHPDLGRSGPVCPFVPSALRLRKMYVAAQRGVPGDLDRVAATILQYRDWFAELEPRTGPQAELKTILILFPDLPSRLMPELIDRTQQALKPAFVASGLMIGEFHPTPPVQPGLWNPDFRPLRSPVPLLAIRQMVPSDLPFLTHDPDLLGSYLHRFVDAVPARCSSLLERALREHNMTTGPGLPADVVASLDGAEHTVHCHAALRIPVRSPYDFAAATGIAVQRVTKTLLVEAADGSPLRIVTSVDQRVDLRRAASLIGIRRLRMSSATTLREVLDQPPGGVSPLGRPEVPVVLDAALLAHLSIMVGAGVAGVDLEIAPGDLVRLTGARVLPLGAARPVADAIVGEMIEEACCA